MDDAIAATVGQRPLVIRVARTPAAPLFQIITRPYILKSGIIGDPRVKILKVTAAAILECTWHQIDTCFLRLDHGLGFGAVASGTRAPRDVDEFHVDAGESSLEHGFELFNTGHGGTTDWIDTVLIRFANQQDFDFARGWCWRSRHDDFDLLSGHHDLCFHDAFRSGRDLRCTLR